MIPILLTVFILFLSVPDSAVGALQENIYGEIVGASSAGSLTETVEGSKDPVSTEERPKAQGPSGLEEASSVRPRYAPPDKQDEKLEDGGESGKTIGESDETSLLISILSVIVLFLLIYRYG